MALRAIEPMQIVSVDAVRRRLNCRFKSGAGPGIPVRMGLQGAADGVRVNQSPMPGPLTWGLVAFPGGDSRSGVWITSVYTSDVDAFTGDGDPYINYQSHWSGAYDLLDGNGQRWSGTPDGSYWCQAQTPGPPTLTKHVVDATQTRVPKAVTPASLVTTAPAPMPWRYHHASGTQVDIADDGHITIQIAAVGVVVEISAVGAVTFSLPAGQTFDVTGGGSAGDALALVSKLVTAFNAHLHEDGGAGVPTVPWTAATIQSALVKVQE